MAVFTKGMTTDEMANLTSCMVSHSDKLRWTDQQWAKVVVDKHSTGGVGDKTSHILAPMIVACGGKVPMISGRGLGLTGGTIDKLESIKGYSAMQPDSKLREMMEEPGFFIVGQTEKLVPADRQLYKYRDVTGTVASIPLITSSILSKKLCEGLCGLVMDIKLGSGALYQNQEEVEDLAKTLVTVGRKLDLKVIAVLSWMDEPLGDCIGNALEMAEVFNILAGDPLRGRLGSLILTLGSNMLATTNIQPNEVRRQGMLLDCLKDGKAQRAMKKMLICQGVEEALAEKLCSDPPDDCEDAIDYYLQLMGMQPTGKTPVKSVRTGYVTQLDAGTIAQVVWRLGAGRDRPDEPIDHTVGIRLFKHVGDYVEEGEIWCMIYHREKEVSQKLYTMTHTALTVLDEPTDFPEVVVKIIE
ncbi:hypothetical protein AAHC03_017076 [Spirometra sp. Aus1]